MTAYVGVCVSTCIVPNLSICRSEVVLCTICILATLPANNEYLVYAAVNNTATPTSPALPLALCARLSFAVLFRF